MTRDEFARVIAVLSLGTGKELKRDAQEVYYELLGDLDADVFALAAKRVLLSHRWATFPTIAELREAAADTIAGQVAELSPAEAWELADRAARKIDPEVSGSADRHLAGLPPLVVEAIHTFGLPALCCSKSPVAVDRAQFVKIYEQLAARDRRLALLPASMRRQIAAVPERIESPAPIVRALALIGKPPE